MKLNDFLVVSNEVELALSQGKAVVALESTIISHGMPYPQNVETALTAEKIVRDNGAIPATIAIINGKLCVGIDAKQIDYLGKKGHSVAKVSRRDIAYIVASKGDGATTVAATMIIAEMAGIKVFATGGIGGVHRNAATTMDISADLDELARTSVLVVCAGAKSILDLGLTLEYLETKGVPVVGYNTKQLPAFYTNKSGFKVDFCMTSPEQIANFATTKWSLGLNGGIVVANPIEDKYSMSAEYINAIIDKAVEQSINDGIKGKDTTPYLLSAIADATGGDSLKANIQLMYNNARLASKIAASME